MPTVVRASSSSTSRVDRAGDARSALGGSALPREVEWWAEHLVLAGLVRCTLASMDYSARRAGLNSTGVGKRARHGHEARDDGLYAFVDIETTLDVELAPAPERRRPCSELVAKAERGCFVSNSLTAKPRHRWIVNGEEVVVSTTALDIASVRARFSALDRRLAFFDGPGGTQCPDEVIDAISRYLREDNANIGAPYETSRRTTELVELRARAGRVVPRLLGGRDRVRAEHDRAQLPPHARVRANAARGRRDRRHRPRPRRERLAVARARARPRASSCASRA